MWKWMEEQESGRARESKTKDDVVGGGAILGGRSHSPVVWVVRRRSASIGGYLDICSFRTRIPCIC
jgi:hypothetical protein